MRALIYIVILIVASACTYSGSAVFKELDRAERLVQSDAEAALRMLNEFDVSEFSDSGTMARWALLYSEAMAANRLTAPTDTIVNIAVDYYGRHDMADKFRKATRLKKMIVTGNTADALATARYLQKEKEFMLYKERAKREQYMLIGLALMLVAACIIVWMCQRIKLQRVRNDALMAEASALRCQIDDRHNDLGQLRSKLHGLLENRFALIDSLCQTYYESQGTKVERKAIIDKVKSEIEAVRSDSFPGMEQEINDCLDNILVKIKDCCHDIKPEDYQLSVYLASGLSTRTISLLLGCSVETVYKRKSRLKSRLKDSVAHCRPDIMDIF